MIFLCCMGRVESSTIIIRLQVLATAMTCLPRPLPSLAPSIIPGKSSNWIFEPLYWSTPGIQVRVVNSYAAIFEKVPWIKERITSKFGEEGTFADWRKSNHTDSSVTRFGDFKTLSGNRFFTSRRINHLSFEFSEFGFKKTDVIWSGLILLCSVDFCLDFSDLLCGWHKRLVMRIVYKKLINVGE